MRVLLVALLAAISYAQTENDTIPNLGGCPTPCKYRGKYCGYYGTDSTGNTQCMGCCDAEPDDSGCINQSHCPFPWLAALAGIGPCTRACNAAVHACGRGSGNCCPDNNNNFKECCRNGWCKDPTQSNYCNSLDGYCCPTPDGRTYLECCKTGCIDGTPTATLRRCCTCGALNYQTRQVEACSCNPNTCRDNSGTNGDVKCCQSWNYVNKACEKIASRCPYYCSTLEGKTMVPRNFTK